MDDRSGPGQVGAALRAWFAVPLILVLGACGSADGDSKGSPTPTPGSTEPQSVEGAGELVVLTDVRLGQHDGFSRIVLQFSGSGTPGWSAQYVDRAVLDGSGDVVELDGDSTLDVYASNTTWPASDYYRGPARLRGEDGNPSVYVGGTFEGYTQVLVGLDGPQAPFRIYTLSKPARLVVDIDDVA